VLLGLVVARPEGLGAVVRVVLQEKYLVLGHGMYHNVFPVLLVNILLVTIVCLVKLANINLIPDKLVAIHVIVALIPEKAPIHVRNVLRENIHLHHRLVVYRVVLVLIQIPLIVALVNNVRRANTRIKVPHSAAVVNQVTTKM
jgi:surface polysaccharide O-acyltransferase-like enzyme